MLHLLYETFYWHDFFPPIMWQKFRWHVWFLFEINVPVHFHFFITCVYINSSLLLSPVPHSLTYVTAQYLWTPQCLYQIFSAPRLLHYASVGLLHYASSITLVTSCIIGLTHPRAVCLSCLKLHLPHVPLASRFHELYVSLASSLICLMSL